MGSERSGEAVGWERFLRMEGSRTVHSLGPGGVFDGGRIPVEFPWSPVAGGGAVAIEMLVSQDGRSWAGRAQDQGTRQARERRGG